MIVSKISFSQHTKEMLSARPLSRKHKSNLRQQRIIEYIREIPFGECSKLDLIIAGGWDTNIQSQYVNGWQFVEGMRRKNVIRMSDGTSPKNSYVKKWEVVADVHTIKPRVGTVEFPTEPTDHTVTNDHGKMTWPEGDGEKTIEPVRLHLPEPEKASDDLLELAKTFAWNTNSDSLREFVAWLKR